MTLKELNIGESAVIETVGGQGALRQHFLDMGLIPGEKVTLVKFAPMGDPMELQIHGYALTLRLDDAAQINVSPAKTVRVVPAACPEQKVVEHQKGRKSAAGRHDPHLCTGGQPELRKDHPVQPAYRLQPACRQFPRRDCGPQERCD